MGRAAALLALAVVATAGAVRAEPDRPPLGTAEVLARRALAPHLKPAEVERLLRAPRVASALEALFDGWDGVADTVEVEREGDAVVLRTWVRERRCLARIEIGPEAGASEPACDEVVRVGGERALALAQELWRSPPPAKTTPPRERVASVAPQAPPPDAQGPVEHTVLRRRHAFALEPGPVALARADHERLKDVLRSPRWHDPLLPPDPVLAGEALAPLEAPAPAVEARVESNLRDPFAEARMRPALPMPDGMDLARDGGVPPLLPDVREDCLEQWRRGVLAPAPPSLDCFRRVAWHDRLAGDDAYQVLSRLASVFQLPLLQSIVAVQIGEATSHLAHRLAWALVWVTWVKDHPDRAAAALARLTPEECRFLRRRLASWWVDAHLAELRPTIARLFERHLTALYPEATDADGLPRRAFVTDTWLWANNWLAVLDGRDDAAIARAFSRLSAPEREVITAFARDRDLRGRWAHAAEVIASL